MSERLDRLDADRRQERVWALGAILHDASRVERIAAKQDWPYLCVRASALERDVYERFHERLKPLSPIHGRMNGVPFSVSQDTLMALWRADSRRVA